MKNFMFLISFLLMMTFVVSTSVQAKDNEKPGGTVVSMHQQSLPEIATWFAEIGIGYASPKYKSDGFQDEYEYFLDKASSHTPVAFNRWSAKKLGIKILR